MIIMMIIIIIKRNYSVTCLVGAVSNAPAGITPAGNLKLDVSDRNYAYFGFGVIKIEKNQNQ